MNPKKKISNFFERIELNWAELNYIFKEKERERRREETRHRPTPHSHSFFFFSLSLFVILGLHIVVSIHARRVLVRITASKLVEVE